MNTKTTSPIGLAIIGFLQREDAKSTFWYERWPILLVEALCLIAGMLAAPNQAAAILLMIDAPRALFHTELGCCSNLINLVRQDEQRRGCDTTQGGVSDRP